MASRRHLRHMRSRLLSGKRDIRLAADRLARVLELRLAAAWRVL